MLKTIRWCLMGLCLAFANAHALPTLIVDPGTGKLLGADGVNVDGTLFDVRFIDGTCIALFSGCDSVADFPFDTSGKANLAALALLSQVFVDGPAGQFDSSPELTLGCSFSGGCEAFIPFGVSGDVLALIHTVNDFDEPFDDVFEANSAPFFDTANSTFEEVTVYAVWTPSASDVPLPGTLSCLGVGVLALVWANRRRALARCRTQ